MSETVALIMKRKMLAQSLMRLTGKKRTFRCASSRIMRIPML